MSEGRSPLRRTLGAVASLLAVAVLARHFTLTGDSERKAREMASAETGASGNVAVSLNPVTNVISIRVGKAMPKDRGNPLEALGAALGSVLSGALARSLEPSIERELNTRAREQLDLYGMLLPYRVRVSTAGEDET